LAGKGKNGLYKIKGCEEKLMPEWAFYVGAFVLGVIVAYSWIRSQWEKDVQYY
jgi:hypothetical protein